MNNKIKNVCDFYAITHKLKTILRQGQLQWGIKADRFESVAEHIYSTQMLAFVIDSEFDLNLDLERVVLMLAIHELGETIVGDFTIIDAITKEDKHKKELEAALQILAPLSNGDRIKNLFLEFEDNITKEAKFAHMVDKLESDFQIKYYDEKRFCNWNTPRIGVMEKIRLERIAAGNKTLSKAWIEFDKEHCNYDELFKKIADYVADNIVFKV